jgi:membrane protease YdiL (CAAX protease family)
LIPCEIGIILYHSKKEHGKYNLQSAFHGYKRMAVPKLICISVFLIVIGALVFTVIGPREDQFMFRTIFSKIPEYYKLGDFFKQYANYPKGMIIATLVTYVIGNGICGPVAEELYFRGFLMPRISRFGNWSPVIITLLFSAYHLFSPWGNVSRILACLPFVYCVYKKKNIYIGMIVHCTLNTASVIMGVIGIISNTAYWH